MKALTLVIFGLGWVMAAAGCSSRPQACTDLERCMACDATCRMVTAQNNEANCRTTASVLGCTTGGGDAGGGNSVARCMEACAAGESAGCGDPGCAPNCTSVPMCLSVDLAFFDCILNASDTCAAFMGTAGPCGSQFTAWSNCRTPAMDGGSCSAAGGACASDADCCTGMSLMCNTAAMPAVCVTCPTNCTMDTDCCSGMCDTTAGTCMP